MRTPVLAEMGWVVSCATGGQSVGPANKKPRAMGSRGGVSPSGLSSRTATPSWLRRAQPCKGAGTLWDLNRLQRPGTCSPVRPLFLLSEHPSSWRMPPPPLSRVAGWRNWISPVRNPETRPETTRGFARSHFDRRKSGIQYSETLAPQDKCPVVQGVSKNGSSEIRTQDQSVKSRVLYR